MLLKRMITYKKKVRGQVNFREQALRYKILLKTHLTNARKFENHASCKRCRLRFW